jgi:L-threonylcarbamoyladenylate synthase
MTWKNDNLIETLKKGGVAVMPTDTLYGIVGQAENISTVNRIYKLKKRKRKKPCIILIGDTKELEKFSVVLSEKQKNKLNEFWPGPISIIFDCPDDSFAYLHRGTKTLSFRLPFSSELRNLLSKVGPLIAPSANPEGLPPAKNIAETKEYFGDSADFYADGGEISGKHSKLIKLHKDGSVNILRE